MKMKNIISIGLILVLTISSFTTINANQLSTYEDIESRSIEQYQELIEVVNDEQYGGAFLDDNGILNVNLPSTMNQKRMMDLIAFNNVIYHNVKYSMEDLQKAHDILIKEDWNKLNLTAIGFNEIENILDLYIPSAPENIESILNSLIPNDIYKILQIDASTSNSTKPIPIENFNTPQIDSEETEDLPSSRASYTVINGSEYENETLGDVTASIGIGVVWDLSTSDPKYGFLTSAHDMELDDEIFYNNVYMGYIAERRMSGSIDAALILKDRSTNTFKNTDEFPDGTTFSHAGGSVPVNASVKRYGAKTTSSGKVLNTNFSVNSDGVIFTNLIHTSATAVSGDSGGPLKYVTTSYRTVVGITKGHVISTGNTVFTKMSEIMSYFDLNAIGPME